MTLEKKQAALLQLCQLGNITTGKEDVVQKMIVERLQCIPRKKLYKFRSCEERHFQLLAENRIWMPPANTFVDLFDSIINIDLYKNRKDFELWLSNQCPTLCFELLKALCESKGLSMPYSLTDLKEYFQTCFDKNGEPIRDKERDFFAAHTPPPELMFMDENIQQLNALRSGLVQKMEAAMPAFVDAINEIRTHVRKSSLVYCMTERYDNCTLWENYGDNYRGFCVEYDFSHFRDTSFEIYKNLVYMFPITYGKVRPYFNIVPCINGIFRQHICKEDNWQNDPELNADLNMQLYYKSKDYEYEHEWRFYIKNTEDSIQKFPFVHAIYVGCNITFDNLRRIVAIAKKLHVPVYQQKLNNARNGFSYIMLDG